MSLCVRVVGMLSFRMPCLDLWIFMTCSTLMSLSTKVLRSFCSFFFLSSAIVCRVSVIVSSHCAPPDHWTCTKEQTKATSWIATTRNNNLPFLEVPQQKRIVWDTHWPSLWFLQHPVTWQPSADGTKLMGRMILRKSVEGQPGDSGAILGKGTLGNSTQFTQSFSWGVGSLGCKKQKPFLLSVSVL